MVYPLNWRRERTFLVEVKTSSRRSRAGEEGTPMLSVVNNDEASAEGRSGLEEICRQAARTMFAAALEVEVEAYLAELADERDEDGTVS